MKKIVLTISFVFIMLMMLTIISTATSAYDSYNNKYNATESNVFYLPSHIKPSSIIIEESGTKKIVDLTSYATLDEKGNKVYKLDIEGKNYTFYFANNLPSIYVTTSISLDSILAPKETRQTDKNSKVFIVDKNGNIQYTDTKDTTATFKVRGNTTDTYNKQPFQFKLDNKQDLFGMGEAKTWILLANYLDQSLIRNSIMYRLGELLGMNTSSYKSVDLYLNGQYYGIYLLCEKVQIQPNRVNIYELEKDNELLNEGRYGYTKKATSGELIDETIITEYQYVRNVENPADISGGYLIELDNNYYSGEKCYFKTENGNAYVIKSPEYASQAQVEYIARVFAEMEEAIYSPTGKNSRGLHYSQYADVESLAYAYIMQELGRNWDAGSSSMYFYKDKDENGTFSKVFKGPLWDCDNTLGNMLKGDANNPEGYWAKDRRFWEGLTQHEYFNYVVAREFSRIYPEIIAMTEENGYISQLVSELGDSVTMERLRWGTGDYSKWPYYSYHLYSHGVHYDSWQGWKMTFKFSEVYSDGVDDTDETAIGYLKNHMVNRANWLKDEWQDKAGTAPSISSDGIIDNTLKLPVAPSFAPNYPDNSNTDSDISSDNITDTDTDTNTDNDISDVKDKSDKKDGDYKVIIVVLAIVAGLGVVGSIVALIKMKSK